MDEDMLRGEWEALTARVGPRAAACATTWWEFLRSHYSEPVRAYHTLQHVRDLLDLTAEVEADLAAPDDVRFAIWFHDVIYDPTRGDNEEESARAWARFGGEAGVAPERVARVAHWIERTKAHDVAPHEARDLQLFMDMDLSILGADAPRYTAYAAAVRHEYAHVPRAAFCEGRARVLESLLDAPTPLFVSARLAPRFTTAAERNMRGELAALRAGHIAGEEGVNGSE